MKWIEVLLSSPDTLIGLLSILATALSGLAGTAWGKRVVDWYRSHLNDRARAIVEGAVVSTYQDTVRVLKAQQGGSLTDDQKKQVFTSCLALIQLNAKDAGIDLAKALGPVAVEALIEQTVTKLKPQPAQVPASVQALFPDQKQ